MLGSTDNILNGRKYVMNKQHKLIYLLFAFVLLISTLPFQASVVHAKSNSAIPNSNNPYVQAYMNSMEQYSSTQDMDPLVDPKVEEQIILNTLELYYELDIKVLDELSNYYPDATTSKEVVSINREDKVNIMSKIMKIYDSVEEVEVKELFLDYLDRYAMGPNDSESEVITFIEENTEKEDLVNTTASYNGTGAGNWAYNNWNYYRRDYPKFTGDFGTDCTNFVSQALHIGGGKSKSGDWTVSRKNLTYWTIDSAYQLNYSWKLTDPSPWISVKEFRSYWRPKSGVSSYSADYYRQNHEQIYSGDIYKGDVLVFHKGIANFVTVPTHLMIISAYDSSNKDFLLAGHTNNRQAYPLLSAISSYSQIEILKIN